jgi:putative transposase
VGVNLSDGMVYVYVDREQFKKLTDIDKLYSARLVYDNRSLYLQINYLKELKKVETEQLKYVGIDIGVGNLMAVFIDDENAASVDGKPFEYYNAEFNRLIGKLNESRAKEVEEWAESKTGTKYPVKYTKRRRFISFGNSSIYST